ncbi:MAG TPA: sigma-70 family RNA polymerase sigma factor [Pseudonocardia sp.]
MPSGRAADLERVFHAEYARVVAIARRVLGDASTAEDIAQEVFLAFARSGVPAAAARGWLAAASVHTALNVVRTERRRVEREARRHRDPALTPAVADRDPVEEVLRGQDRERVRAALATLPRAQAVALVLRHSGASYIEIADALGVSATGVGTLLRRAEAAVRKELTGDAARR